MNIISDLKTFRFWRYLFLHSLAFGGFVSAAMQFLLMIDPGLASLFQGTGSLTIVAVASIAYGLVKSWPRPIEMEFSAPKTKIRIIKGDLLEQDGHIVVGVCDTFDTETPNIISRNSLLGQTISNLYGGDTKQIDRLLEKALENEKPVGEIKKDGKTSQYELGTVAVVRHEPRFVFFLAYCEMNERNEAFGTVDAVWKSLSSLWAAQSVHGNHSSISVPVIGGGQARMSSLLPAQDSIRIIALSFMFASRKHKVSDELRIVVQPADYDRLDRMELQSFLSSLRPS
ncbi:macro domain-containing protein [Rhizobium ruizarguesonis]